MHSSNQTHKNENSVSHNKINSPSQDTTTLHPPVQRCIFNWNTPA